MIIYESTESKLGSIKGPKVWIIDDNLLMLNRERIEKLICKDKFFVLKSLESNKSIEKYHEILDFLFENNIDRSTYLIGLGGGIIGDLTAFVASTYKRGLKLIHIPTTLLSMVDSSIGGKTGINNKYGKNMIGTIYQAENIIIDLSWLETLDDDQFTNGFAEVIKMSLIKGGELFDLVCKVNPFNSINSSKENLKNLEDIVKLSAQYKLDIIENDFEEKNGQRELLNLGHTFGHAYELSEDKLHGYSVAVGTILEFY